MRNVSEDFLSSENPLFYDIAEGEDVDMTDLENSTIEWMLQDQGFYVEATVGDEDYQDAKEMIIETEQYQDNVRDAYLSEVGGLLRMFNNAKIDDDSVLIPDRNIRSEDFRIIPSFLNMRNPLIVDYDGGYREESFSDAMDRARDGGHDGLILKNVTDGGGFDNIYAVFSPDQVILAEPVDRSAQVPWSQGTTVDIAPGQGILTEQQILDAEKVIHEGLQRGGLKKTDYNIVRQKGLFTDYDNGGITIESSFRVILNSDDPVDINAFVEVMNNFAQDNEQRSYVVTKYIGKTVSDQLGKPGKNGGIIDPGIMIKFDTPLNEDQKISVVKLAQKHGLPGLSIADDGSYAVAYKSGELYGNETPITFANKAKAFEEEFGIGSGEGLSGVGGAVSPFMQELWAFTSDAGNNSTATYQQVRSSLAKASREVSVLQLKHVKQIP